MTHKFPAILCAALVAATPAAATQSDGTMPSSAPTGNEWTEYCLRVGPVTGRLSESVACMTRAEWASQGVDVDKEWAKEGVRTRG